MIKTDIIILCDLLLLLKVLLSNLPFHLVSSIVYINSFSLIPIKDTSTFVLKLLDGFRELQLEKEKFLINVFIISPAYCNLCDKNFIQLYNYKMHVKKRHMDELERLQDNPRLTEKLQLN